jgi:hypothetical protein
MARAIEKRLGRSVFVAPSRAELAIEAYAERVAGPGWHVVISVSSEDGSIVGDREFWSQEPSCAAVADSAALAIALTIDPDAALRPEPPAAPSSAEPGPGQAKAPPSDESVPVPPVVPSPPPSWRGALEVATGAATGLLPGGFSPGVFVRARALEPSRTIGLELEGAYFFEQQVDVRANTGAAFSLLYAGASLCALPWGTRRVSGLVCAGADIGSMAVRGYGFADTAPESQNLIVNLAGRARLVFRVQEHWAVLVGGDIFVPLSRDHFDARLGDVTRELFRAAPVAGGFELGVAYEL